MLLRKIPVLDQVYNLYVRPHLGYGDIVYHKTVRPHLGYGDIVYYNPKTKLDVTNRIEQTQYSAALAVTGTWRGTSRQRLYDELGWEDLYSRRWYRRLCHFYNLRKTCSPEYLFAEIPCERQLSYNLGAYDQNVGRTVRFTNTYFQNTLFEWNLLADDINMLDPLQHLKVSCCRPYDR